MSDLDRLTAEVQELSNIVHAQAVRLAPERTALVVDRVQTVVAPWAAYAKGLVAVLSGFVVPAAASLSAGALSDGISAQELLTAAVAGLVGSGLIGGGVLAVPNKAVDLPAKTTS